MYTIIIILVLILCFGYLVYHTNERPKKSNNKIVKKVVKKVVKKTAKKIK